MNSEEYRRLKEKAAQEAMDAMFLSIFQENLMLEDSQNYTVYMCSECGAVVRNTGVHFNWHQRHK